VADKDYRLSVCTSELEKEVAEGKNILEIE
jgi:hypothetical protein